MRLVVQSHLTHISRTCKESWNTEILFLELDKQTTELSIGCGWVLRCPPVSTLYVRCPVSLLPLFPMLRFILLAKYFHHVALSSWSWSAVNKLQCQHKVNIIIVITMDNKWTTQCIWLIHFRMSQQATHSACIHYSSIRGIIIGESSFSATDRTQKQQYCAVTEKAQRLIST